MREIDTSTGSLSSHGHDSTRYFPGILTELNNYVYEGKSTKAILDAK